MNEQPAPAGPVTPIDLDALLSPAGPYETGPDAGNADGAQLVRDQHGNPTWWAPMHGCDSLDDLLSRIRGRLLPLLQQQPTPTAEGEAAELAECREALRRVRQQLRLDGGW